VIARLKLGGKRPLTPLMMIQQYSSSSQAIVALAREEIMSRAKGLDIKKYREERGERSVNLEDKMLMNKSRREVHRARQNPRRGKGPLEASTLHHRVLQL
jgi:hypothetical protein